ncbi:hypothetical protein ACM66B_005391 [Microbotryomycetes sp. NB124-2]
MATTTWSRPDTDSIRQSFPVTVRESDSYGTLVDVTRSSVSVTKRESMPPPPVPPKPVILQSGVPSSLAQAEARPARSPAVRSSTPWLDLMFQQDDDDNINTKSVTHTPPSPNEKRRAPALPPRPTSQALPQPPVRTASSSATAPSFSSRLAQTNQQLKLKDRLATGVSIGREWGGRGRELLQEGWKMGSAAVSQATSSSTTSSLNGRLSPMPSSEPMTKSSSSSSSLEFATKSRSKTGSSTVNVFGVRVPTTNPQMVFGLPLPVAVSNTAIKASSVVKPVDPNPVTGDEAARWLPRIAWRCLQYLEHNAKTEEGIYRVPGRAHSVAQLRSLFDAGLDVDLREIHPGDLDPHAVASLFKSWLRELPESLLSPKLEPLIDGYSLSTLGYPASVSQMLGSKDGGSPPSSGGLVNGKACDEYVDRVRHWFSEELEAEYFYLLRAISFHLHNLSTHSATNKMGLANLRLILSPTLRLSPVFLAILVEERETLFSGPNHSARARSLPAEELARALSVSSLTPSAPDGEYSKPLPLSNGDTSDSLPFKLTSSEPVSSTSFPLTPSPALSSFATPIADKFSSTFAATSPTLASHPTVPTSSYVPSRSEPNALFVNRAQAPGSAKTSPRLESSGDSLQGLGFNNVEQSQRRPVFGGSGVKPSAIPLLPPVSASGGETSEEHQEGGWSLLSVEERRKLFGG